MGKCKLCKVEGATKKGSHIIPHFLTKKVDSANGSSSRDMELGFLIQKDFTSSYFGRSVLPDNLNSVLGEISDEEIENNEVYHIVDFYFCHKCEKRFSFVESEYAKAISNSVNITNTSPEISFLFWISIIWRISVYSKDALSLKKKEENYLRIILDRHLPFEQEKLNFNRFKNDVIEKGLGYYLIRSPNYCDNEAGFVFIHPSFRQPYSFIIGEYVLFFFFKKTHEISCKQSFFGFEKDLEKAPRNCMVDKEQSFVLNHDTFNQRVSKLIDFQGNNWMKETNRKLNLIHQRLGGEGKVMPPEVVSYFFNEFFKEKQPSLQFKPENFINALKITLKHFSKQRRIAER